MPQPNDPLIAQLRALMTRRRQSQEGWQSGDELASALGVPPSKCSKLLRQLHREAALEVSRQYRLAIDGVERPVPVYRIKAAPRVAARGDARRVRRVPAGAGTASRKVASR
jgi:hypothetical protein